MSLKNLSEVCDGNVIGPEVRGESPPSRAAIAKAVEAAREFAASSGLSPADRDRLCVIMEELVTNVVIHGHASLDSRVRFAIKARRNEVLIELRDAGVAFDPRHRAETRAGPKLSGARNGEGGWGWPIVLAWTEALSYCREDGENRLGLVMPATYGEGA